MSPASRPTGFIVPHTHWDREWYQTTHQTRTRLVDTIDDLIDRLERDSRIGTFLLDGQLAVLDDYLSVRPDMTPRVRKLARAGRLQLGPWYVLADEFLVSDETLVRNLLYGRAAAEPFGAWLKVGYSPDAFGHPGALPSIFVGFGLRHAIVWRGYGDDPQGPDLFRWTGPDGAEVLVHHLPAAGYEIGAELPVESGPLKKRWTALRRTLEPRSSTGHLLIPNGADHHALQPDIADAVRTLGSLESRWDFRIASPTEYFRAVQGASAPVVEGELRCSPHYAWSLQGVHATRSRLKRLVAEGERLLTGWVEPQATLAWANGARDRRPLLRDTWHRHLRSCAHDSIGGCCADPVARDVEGRAAGVVETARVLLDETLFDRVGLDRTAARRERARTSPSLLVANPCPRPRTAVVETTVTYFVADVPVGSPEPPPRPPSDEPPVPRLVAASGEALPVQVLETAVTHERFDSPRDYPDQDLVHAVRVAVQVPDVDAFGIDTLRVEQGPSRATPNTRVRSGPGRLEAAWGSVVAASDGFDWRVDGSRTLRGVPIIWSERDEGDTYTFQPVSHDRGAVAEWGDVTAGWDGPLIATVSREFTIPGRVHGSVVLRLDAGSELVRVVVQGENLVGGHRLRVGVPVPAMGHTVADLHYGPVERERTDFDPIDYPREWPVRTAPMHRYVSAPGARSDPGVTLFARGVYEYELTDDDALAVTAFRAVETLSRGDLRARPGHAGWPMPTPDARELGPFRIELALIRDSVDLDAAPDEWQRLEHRADEFHAPMIGRMVRHFVGGAGSASGPSLAGAGLVFKSLKPAHRGEGIVVRCVNVTESVVDGVWEWPGRLEGAALARLDETTIRDVPHDGNPARVRFQAQSREVVTLIFWPARA